MKEALKITLIFTTALFVSGCCWWKTRGWIPDHINTYVIVGTDEREDCPSPRKDDRGYVLGVDKQLAVWVRAVFYNALNTPVSDIDVNFEVIDAFGDRIESPSAAVIPATVATDKKGFSTSDVIFSAQMPGVYRIRAIYPDKHATNSSLSIPIIVTNVDGEPPAEALKRFGSPKLPKSFKGTSGYISLPVSK